MEVITGIAGILIIVGILWDGFETVVLPRRVTRRLRITHVFQRATWKSWAAIGSMLAKSSREAWLGLYAPLSLIWLLITWAGGLILGFALVQWALGSNFSTPDGGVAGFGTVLYVSGTTFFTLGLGDVFPVAPLARFITVVEAGTGFGLLALVITYLPVLYQAFSQRESHISMLDEWAGSPPSAIEFLRRLALRRELGTVGSFLREWESWTSDLLETHLTYPVLAYYRSQHEHQSWLGALTMVLDLSTLVMIGIEGVPVMPAQLTFAIARHSIVDLIQVLGVSSNGAPPDRLPADELEAIWQTLRDNGVPVLPDPDAGQRLAELRRAYEPYVTALSHHLQMPLPPWTPSPELRDNWRASPWIKKN